jgi:hypothetical protein
VCSDGIYALDDLIARVRERNQLEQDWMAIAAGRSRLPRQHAVSYFRTAVHHAVVSVTSQVDRFAVSFSKCTTATTHHEYHGSFMRRSAPSDVRPVLHYPFLVGWWSNEEVSEILIVVFGAVLCINLVQGPILAAALLHRIIDTLELHAASSAAIYSPTMAQGPASPSRKIAPLPPIATIGVKLSTATEVTVSGAPASDSGSGSSVAPVATTPEMTLSLSPTASLRTLSSVSSPSNDAAVTRLHTVATLRLRAIKVGMGPAIFGLLVLLVGISVPYLRERFTYVFAFAGSLPFYANAKSVQLMPVVQPNQKRKGAGISMA